MQGGDFLPRINIYAIGVSALVLAYAIVPGLIYVAQRMKRRVFLGLAIVLFSLVMMVRREIWCLKMSGCWVRWSFIRV